MQQSVNIFQLYCEKWKLEVNLKISKVMIFRKRKSKKCFFYKSKKKFNFFLQNKKLEILDFYLFRCFVFFKYNGTFLDTKKKLIDQTQKSMHFIHRIVRNKNNPVFCN